MKLTRQSILAAGGLLVGGFIGASALVALADWTPPKSTPPVCVTDPSNANFHEGCLAPINVGSVQQNKFGWLGVVGLVTTNLTVASGTINTAGSVLTNDGLGNAKWGTISTSMLGGDNCDLITSTDLTNGPLSGPRYRLVNVPPICINSSCALALVAYDSSGVVPSGSLVGLRTTSLIQMQSTARVPKGGGVAYWWAKSGGAFDGTECNAGRNGSTAGCDVLVKINDNLVLYDDYSEGETTNASQWTLRDTTDTYSSELYVCK